MNGSAPSRRAIAAWSLYDLANTVYFFLVATRYLPTQLAKLTGSESSITAAYVPAMLLSAVLSPALGVRVDRVGGARRLALAFTLICCVATASMALVATALPLVLLYVVARFTYEMAAVPYNALLPALVGRESIGWVSGIGVGLGYLGNLVAFGLILSLDLDKQGYGALYVIAALLFFGFTLPLRFCVPELTPNPAAPVAAASWRAAFRDGFAALRRQLGPPERRAFFIGVFFACDAVNTVIQQVARYAERPEGLGFASEGVDHFLLAVQLSCIVGGFAFGRASDRFGGRRATLVAVAFLFIAFVLAQFTPWQWLRVGAIGTIGGAGLAGVWAASRHWLVQLVPEAEQGEAFGVYGLVQRASLLTLWPFTALVDWNAARGAPSYVGSVGVLLGALAIGFWLMLRARTTAK